MTALKTASNLSFAKSAVAAAAGGQAHAGDPELAHGLQPKNSISLEDAARLIRETAEKLWRGSTASVQSLIDMLLNFFRWITRPFRVGLSGNAPADGTTHSDSNGPKSAVLDRNNVMSPAHGSPIEPVDASGSGLDDDDRVPSSPEEGGPSPVKLKGPFGFPKSYVGPKTDGGQLPLDADTVRSVMQDVSNEFPDPEDMDLHEAPTTMAVSLLKNLVSKVAESEAKARVIDEQIQTQLVALAAVGDKPADQLLDQVLASPDAGGLPGAEIRRLHVERGALALNAAALRGEIENSLLHLKQQGMDVASIAARAQVVDALPDWPARLDRVATAEPPAPTAAERHALAIEVEPDSGIDLPSPSPERIARLKAALISKNSNDEHEQDRPRG
ncbi:hypothetical protein LJR290_007775 [Variovorax sp. LjRoot290]|uniref:hypothetical protein n=1 Tax=unclassified Variovorax TaxID=663243 RepID=UPI003ECF0848